MTFVIIFLGWLILCSLWGFLPLVEPLRQYAIRGVTQRRTAAFGSALPALVIGAILLLWISCYITILVSAYTSHADLESSQGFSQGDINASVISAANELFIREFSPDAGCSSADSVTCLLASAALAFGNPLRMLPLILGVSLIPAMVAGCICWQLTPPLPVKDML